MPCRWPGCEQIERRPPRNEEQQRVLLLALDLGVRVRERRLEVVRDVLVELGVLLVGDLGLGPGPQRDAWLTCSSPMKIGMVMWSEYLRRIWRSAGAWSSVVLALAQVQDDVGAARLADDGLDAVVALAGALPAHAVLGRRARRAG